jgi:hypothetical protein
LSSALMLSGEVNPGVASAKAAIDAPATRRTMRTRWRRCPPNGLSLAPTFSAERVMAGSACSKLRNTSRERGIIANYTGDISSEDFTERNCWRTDSRRLISPA